MSWRLTKLPQFFTFLTTHHLNHMKIVWLLRGALSVEVAGTHFTVQNVSEMKNYLTETSASKGECVYVY